MHFIFDEQGLRELNYSNLSSYFRGKMNRLARVARSAKVMYDGDMWDSGRGYIGPIPEPDDKDGQKLMAGMAQRFTGRNCVFEVTERLVDAILSRSPNWEIFNKKNILARSKKRAEDRAKLEEKLRMLATAALQNPTGGPEPLPPEPVGDPNTPEAPKDEIPTDERIPEAELLSSELWGKLKLKSVLEQAFSERLVVGEGKIRIRFSRKLLDNLDESVDENGRFDAFLDVIKYIKVEYTPNDQSKVLDDDGEALSITKIEDKRQKQVGIELSFVEDTSNLTFIATVVKQTNKKSKATDKSQLQNNDADAEEIETEVDQEDSTVSEIIEKIKEVVSDISTGFNLDGNILVGELKGRPYISESMLQNNRALNLDLSLAAGVLIESGFQEMITTNAALGGPDGKTVNIKRGPTTSNNLVGMKSVDQYGTITYSNVDVKFKDPTPLTTFETGENLFYRQILCEAKQQFILGTDSKYMSGESRVQSRVEFLKTALRFKPDMDNFGSWLVTTLIHLVASISGFDGYFQGLGVSFDTRVSPGELSSDEKNTVILMQEKGLIDREAAMVLLGIEDPILTLDKVRFDQAESLEYQAKQMQINHAFGQSDTINPNDSSVRAKNNANKAKIAAQGK